MNYTKEQIKEQEVFKTLDELTSEIERVKYSLGEAMISTEHRLKILKEFTDYINKEADKCKDILDQE